MKELKTKEVLSAVYDELHEDLMDWGGGKASVVPRGISHNISEDVVQVDFQIMGVNQFSAPVKLSEEISDKMTDELKSKLEENEYTVQLTGSATLNELLTIHMQGDYNGNYTIKKLSGPIFSMDNVRNYHIVPESISVGGTKYREVAQKYHMIKDLIKIRYNQYLIEDLYIEGRTIHIAPERGLSEENFTALIDCSEVLGRYKNALQKLKNRVKSSRTQKITTNPTDGNAIYYERLYKEWSSKFMPILTELPETVKNIKHKIKNDHETQMAISRISDTASKEIFISVSAISDCIKEYPNMIKKSKNDYQMAHEECTYNIVTHLQLTEDMVNTMIDCLGVFLTDGPE